MFVGVCRLTLLVPETGSLKDRRRAVSRLKDQVRAKFNVAVAEVGDLESAEAQLGMVVVSNERAFTESMLQKIIDHIDELGLGKIVDDEKDIIDYGDGEVGSDVAHWEPGEPSPMTTATRRGVMPAGRPKLRIPVRGARRGAP